MPAPTTSMHRLAELDALRGLAALAVALFHLTWFVPFMVPGAPRASADIWWGCYGVQLFFAISGFVILGTLERTRDLADFARARARRLLPEYWLAMTLTAIVAASFAPDRLTTDAPTWLFNLPPIQLWTGVRMVDDVYWSLTIEIGFYAAIALVHRLVGMARIEAVVVGWIVVAALLRATAAPAWLVRLLLAEHAPYFAIGLVAFRIWTGERRVARQLPVLAMIAAAGWWFDPLHPRWLAATLVVLFLLLATRRLRWLGHPALVWMGAISYPFYLLHAVIGYTILARLEAIGAGPDMAALVALLVAGLLAIGVRALAEGARRLCFDHMPALASA